MREKLESISDKVILPEKTDGTNPSWFGFLMTVRDDAGFTRDEITQYLENKNIQTRNLFSGNYIKHPCFDEMRKNQCGYRVVGSAQGAGLRRAAFQIPRRLRPGWRGSADPGE